MAAIDYLNDSVRAAFVKLEARAAAAEAGAITVPAAPTLTAARGNGQVTLSWVDGATGGAAITGHKLYAGPSPSTLALVGTITSASPYIETGLPNGTTRYYALTALNSVGESANSTVANATPAPTPVPASTYANSTEARANTTGFSSPLQGVQQRLATIGYPITLDYGSGSDTATGTTISPALMALQSRIATAEAALTPTPISISGTPGGGTTGVAYTFSPTTANGRGSKAFALSGTLPAGLAFSTATGTISGTPTTAATTSGLTITVTDTTGSASLGPFSIAVVSAATAPGAPVIGVTPGNGQNIIALTTPAAANGSAVTRYDLYRADSSGSYGSTPYVSNVSFPYTDVTANGTPRYYAATATNGVGTSPKSAEKIGTPVNNLLTSPNDFTTWQYNGLLSVTPDVAVNPISGVTNADRLSQSTGTSSPHNMTTPSAAQGGVTNGQTYTYAFDVKSETQQFVQLNMNSNINGGYANFDIINGTVIVSDTFTPSIQDLGNGWKRIIVTFLCYSTTAFVGAFALPVTGTAGRRANELVPNGSGKSLIVANAQLVAGTVANAF